MHPSYRLTFFGDLDPARGQYADDVDLRTAWQTFNGCPLAGWETSDVYCWHSNIHESTFGSKAEPGTIRGDHGVSNSFNLIHGSDSPQAAEKELALFFPEGCLDYDFDALRWIYDPEEEWPGS